MTSSVNWDKELHDVKESTPVKADYRELLIAERCDRCTAQAFVRAVTKLDDKEMELLFCNHHYKENAPQLMVQGFLIDDQSYKLNEKPTEPDPEHF